MTKIFDILDEDCAREIRTRFGTPTFVYNQHLLTSATQRVLNFPHSFGLTARYAMKALPTAAILRIFNQQGLHIDASSGHEVERALKVGIAPQNIQLTAQELPHNVLDLARKSVLLN